jgi:hypothetical protein
MKVLHIGTYKLGRLLQYGHRCFINKRSNIGPGKWDRQKLNFKGKIDMTRFKEWIEAQPKSLSHFTRNKTRNQLWYFTDVTGFRELYRKYKSDMVANGDQYMSSTSFYYKLKKTFPNLKFHAPILDACSTCLQLRQIHQKLHLQNDKALIMNLLCKHQDEADGRYIRWRKDRSKVSFNFSKEEIEVIFHSKKNV